MRKRYLLLILFTAQWVTGQDLGVMTYNIRYDNPEDGANQWNNRKEQLISQLNFYQPDIFGTQEGLAHQLKEIEQGLDGYAYVGVGRDDGNQAGEFTAIFFNQNTMDLMEQSTFWLSPTPDEISKGWDAALPRICTYGLLKRKLDGRKFFVFNAHFDHVGHIARKESAQLVLKKIEVLNTDRLPVVFMGDLNLEPHQEGIQLILGKMQDTYTAAGKNVYGPKGTFNGFDVSKPVNRRIDYIFVANGFQVFKTGVLSAVFQTRYPSDHFPVFSLLRFPLP